LGQKLSAGKSLAWCPFPLKKTMQMRSGGNFGWKIMSKKKKKGEKKRTNSVKTEPPIPILKN